MSTLPALCVIGSASKRGAILELAAEAERRGFAGLACPGAGGSLAMCASLAHVTHTIPFWTSIQPIYLAQPIEIAGMSAHIHEVSQGRFRLGLGVSHERLLARFGVTAGKPLSDTRSYVEAIRASIRATDALPPIWIAALRNRMLDLALEISDGALLANACLSYSPVQVERIPADRRDTFMFANMLPTVIDEDRSAARAIHRKTLATTYISLPNYRNYWRLAGYVEEMDAIETALAAGDRDAAAAAMSDRWIDDCTISGGPDEVRERLEAWFAIGVTPIAVMSSTSGGQAKAIRELFDLYA